MLKREIEKLEIIAHQKFESPSSSSSSSRGASDADLLPSSGAAAVSRGTPPKKKKSVEEVEREFASAQQSVSETLAALESRVQQFYEQSASLGLSDPRQHTALRFQSALEDHKKEVVRAERALTQRVREHRLISGVDGGAAQALSPELRYLMDEQHSLRSTMTRVNRVLEEAESTRRVLGNQKERFNNTEESLLQILNRIPMIHQVLGRINEKRRREVVVLAFVIGICFFITVVCW